MSMLTEEMQLIIESKVNEFSRTALIDKLVLSNVFIQGIRDTNELNEKGMLCNGKSKMKYYTKNGEEFTSLNIKDDFFGKLKAGVNYGTGGLYSSFATSVRNGICSNLVCNTMDDYKNQIENAKKYLVEKYGIYVDFENSIVNSIETPLYNFYK